MKRIALLAIALTFITAVILWFRERWRREAFPASDAPALLNPARRLIQSPARVVQATGITAGNIVLELGPGPGTSPPKSRPPSAPRDA